MTEKEVKALIEEAHQIFRKNSVYEVLDMERLQGISTLVEFYGPVFKDDLERYFCILDLIRVDEINEI